MYKMSIKSLFIWIIVAILGSESSDAAHLPNTTDAVNFPNTTVSPGTECEQKTNYTCVKINDCPTALSMLQENKPLDNNYLPTCGFERNVPKVCCPLKESIKIIYNDTEEIATRKPSNTPKIENISKETEMNTMILKLNSSPLPSRKICGQLVSLDERITGGTITRLDEFPWLARIKYRSKPDGAYYGCAASLITNQHLLTAAHCLKNKIDRLVSVRLGEWDEETESDCRGSICNNRPVDRKINETFIYEGFDSKNPTTGDIALIKLDKPVNYTKFIAPVCLPNTEYVTQQDNTQSSTYWSAGWGITEFGLLSPIKRKVDLKAVHTDICRKVYPDIPKEAFETLICAGGVKGKDTCSGDSGGPLVKLVTEDYQVNWYLFGITSFGSAECGTEGKPAMYTRITSHMNWILEKIKN